MRYQKIEKIGQGTYGKVYRGINLQNNQIVAMKQVKINSKEQRIDEGIPSTTLREISALKSLDHPNIINALDHCHSRRILHRDLKPANILVDRNSQQLKVADFGLARLFTIPIQEVSLEIETLWYRAPEVLLGDISYSLPVDMWSCGCIFAELILGQPLFQGDSEIGQIFEIFKFFGTPVNIQAITGCVNLKFWSFKFPKFKSNKSLILQRFNSFNAQATDLFCRMLTLEPLNRISFFQALQHPFFQ